ncbi:MAG: hypothetical protein GVY10_03915, partial [Verrucomicrobia bacterium]|nr:hypothetical protein [Verrucomicrobiota bacterium]
MRRIRGGWWGSLAVLGSAVLLLLGYFYFLRQPGDKAEEWYTEGQRAHANGDFPGATSAFEKALSKDPSHPEAGFALFDAIAFFEPERAEELLEKLADTSLPAERIQARRLQLALRANRMEEARRLAADLQGEKETFEVLHGLTRLS